jgi:hypothetical protein
MTEFEENELKFLSARNRLEGKLIIMKDFVVENREKMNKSKYQNLFEISSLGLMLILENRMMFDELTKLRTQLNREMAINTQNLIKDGKS